MIDYNFIIRMINHNFIYFKRIVYNSKLNREKFIINKKKMNMINSQQIKKFCTYNKNPDNEPNNPKIDYLLMSMMAITCYYVNKKNKTN
jgi:hypothetical protein